MFKKNNNCYFEGILAGNPKEIQIDNVIKATFLLKVSDGSDFVLIPCELWSNAAELFLNKYQEGDSTWIQCTYKTDKWKKDGEIRTKNIYRVNHFGDC